MIARPNLQTRLLQIVTGMSGFNSAELVDKKCRLNAPNCAKKLLTPRLTRVNDRPNTMSCIVYITYLY